MPNSLLSAPERGAIEVFLRQQTPAGASPPGYERLLGFLSGVVITPGGLMPSEWFQPLLDYNGIVFTSADDARRFMELVLPLFNRVNDLRIANEVLCPFDWSNVQDLGETHRQAAEWATGLHDSLKLRPDIWGLDKQDVRHVPSRLVEEARHAVVFLWAIAEPAAIPGIVPDPLPFQRNFLSRFPGWKDEMLSESWNAKLVEMYRVMCVSRLSSTSEVLQRYARAYDGGRRAGLAKPAVSPGKPRVGRNDACPCGSGLKYKRCCGR